MAMRVFAECGVDLLLSGHLHHAHAGDTAARYRVPGFAALVVQAGTATSTRGRGEPNAFNVIRAGTARIEVDVQAWQFAIVRPSRCHAYRCVRARRRHLDARAARMINLAASMAGRSQPDRNLAYSATGSSTKTGSRSGLQPSDHRVHRRRRHRGAAGRRIFRRLPQVREDAAARHRRGLRVVLDHEAEAIALVAIGMQVAAHRFGRLRDRGGADDFGIDDAVVQRRSADVDAVIRRLHRCIRQGRVRVGASPKASPMANTPAGLRPSPSRFTGPGWPASCRPSPQAEPLRPTITGCASPTCRQPSGVRS